MFLRSLSLWSTAFVLRLLFYDTRVALRVFICAEDWILNYSFGEFGQFEKQMAWSSLHRSKIWQKRTSRSLPLIYCKAKIVYDSLFVDLFHAAAVRTTLLFRVRIFCQSHQYFVSMWLLPSTQVFNNAYCLIKPLKWISDTQLPSESLKEIIARACYRKLPFLFDYPKHIFFELSAMFAVSAIQILTNAFRQMRKCV